MKKLSMTINGEPTADAALQLIAAFRTQPLEVWFSERLSEPVSFVQKMHEGLINMTLTGKAMVAAGLKLVGWKKAGLWCKQVGAMLETADFVDVTNHDQPGVPIVYCHEKQHASGGKIRVLHSVDAVQVHIIKSKGESEYCEQS